MPVIRTPEERFQYLPEYPFQPHYMMVNGMRMHYVDEGQGEVILCLHGEPSWSYLYRKMIPILARQHRVIALDFIGFGRSDKYTEREEYSFQMHVDALVGFIEALNLTRITLVVQDWGGLIGLPVAASMPERFARLVIMNTGLPTGDEPMTEGFKRWFQFSQRVPDMDIGRVIVSSMVHSKQIPPAVVDAYNSPFPDITYKAGAMAFPQLVPVSPDNPASAAMRQTRERLSHWEKPTFIMFSDGDPITRGGERFFRALIPTAKDQPEVTIRDAGHFLQEEKGEEIAHLILAFIARTPEMDQVGLEMSPNYEFCRRYSDRGPGTAAPAPAQPPFMDRHRKWHAEAVCTAYICPAGLVVGARSIPAGCAGYCSHARFGNAGIAGRQARSEDWRLQISLALW